MGEVVKILVLIPTKPTLCQALRSRSIELSARMQGANPDHELTIIHDYRKVESLPTDKTAWARVTRARQALLDSIDVLRWDYVLWIDADVVEYPADMPSRLILANPDGIAAPMVFIEGQEARLYDWAAFIQDGRSHIEPNNPAQIKGRNLSHDAPYWDEPPPDRTFGHMGIMPMDCVGTIVMVQSRILAGHVFDDHPVFTDWFTLCKKARKIHGPRGVVVDRGISALHADLGSGKYENEQWH